MQDFNFTPAEQYRIQLEKLRGLADTAYSCSHELIHTTLKKDDTDIHDMNLVCARLKILQVSLFKFEQELKTVDVKHFAKDAPCTDVEYCSNGWAAKPIAGHPIDLYNCLIAKTLHPVNIYLVSIENDWDAMELHDEILQGCWTFDDSMELLVALLERHVQRPSSEPVAA